MAPHWGTVLACREHGANADVWKVSASAPQLEPASFVGRLFLFFNLAAVLLRWDLKADV